MSELCALVSGSKQYFNICQLIVWELLLTFDYINQWNNLHPATGENICVKIWINTKTESIKDKVLYNTFDVHASVNSFVWTDCAKWNILLHKAA